jgi:hypothetical protein
MTDQSNPFSQPERRRTPRTEVLGRIRVRVLSAPDADAIVREMSTGGFSLETRTAPPHGVHRFEFLLEDEAAVVVSAESVHSARIAQSDGGAIFVSGFEFVPAGAVSRLAIARLNDRIASLCFQA